ncbi:MAG: DUF3627 domain-containing protein, partial [Bacteroidota bacterium]
DNLDKIMLKVCDLQDYLSTAMDHANSIMDNSDDYSFALMKNNDALPNNQTETYTYAIVCANDTAYCDMLEIQYVQHPNSAIIFELECDERCEEFWCELQCDLTAKNKKKVQISGRYFNLCNGYTEDKLVRDLKSILKKFQHLTYFIFQVFAVNNKIQKAVV